MQDNLHRELGPEYGITHLFKLNTLGFDLSKIKLHYDHRRKMRAQHDSLRYGSLIFLNALTVNNEPHSSVFAFSRSIPEETAIVAINFHNSNTSYKLDLQSLLPMFDFEINFNSVCYIEDWINETKGDFYFLREVINEEHTRNIQVSIF